MCDHACVDSLHHSETLVIPATHAALPGHFPQQPVVPGVVLLDRVIAATEREWNVRAHAVPEAKFLRPLLPGQRVDVRLTAQARIIRFRIQCAGEAIAVGRIEVSE